MTQPHANDDHSGSANEAIAELLRRIDRGEAVDERELCAEFPAAAAELSDYLATARQVEQMAELVYDGFTIEEIAEVCIYPFYPAEGGLDSPRTFMRQVIQAKIPTDLDGSVVPWSGAAGGTKTKKPEGSADVDNKVPWDEDEDN